MKKRLQGVSVTGQMVAAAFPTGTIPESARFMHAYFDYERNVFVCVFEDEAFAEVPEGCRIPIDVDNHVRGVPWLQKPMQEISTTTWHYADGSGNPVTADEYVEATREVG